MKLPQGTLDVGRMADCWLTLDDDLTSRYHARFHVGAAGVELEDLGSRNGTFVNGQQIEGRRRLAHGDELRIGRETIAVLGDEEEDEANGALRRTIGPGEDSKFPTLIGQLVEKSLNMGKLKEAERYALALTNQLTTTRVAVDHPTSLSAVRCLVALAEKTASGVWIDRLFKLHAVNRWIIRPEILERVRGALDRIPRVPGNGMQDYEAALRQMSREGEDVDGRLTATIAELTDAYTKN
ncbi:FHA domain-containing protein [Pseudenhygromyxa sp. WMMC2535]|uniref:FHA domain-containing protein n=1 Tax=Pseudenhygromyxa sp. WMMC2535 TaxID=2712867 RepID=UPI00155513A5|nr:FHA domain-containing protein [Pseudenhygromyxa sp. WMMC2535]NVB41927.1 FHA domain-containing protein [Pseudenhygromyxa sp. WMMC2535]